MHKCLNCVIDASMKKLCLCANKPHDKLLIFIEGALSKYLVEHNTWSCSCMSTAPQLSSADCQLKNQTGRAPCTNHVDGIWGNFDPPPNVDTFT